MEALLLFHGAYANKAFLEKTWESCFRSTFKVLNSSRLPVGVRWLHIQRGLLRFWFCVFSLQQNYGKAAAVQHSCPSPRNKIGIVSRVVFVLEMGQVSSLQRWKSALLYLDGMVFFVGVTENEIHESTLFCVQISFLWYKKCNLPAKLQLVNSEIITSWNQRWQMAQSQETYSSIAWVLPILHDDNCCLWWNQTWIQGFCLGIKNYSVTESLKAALRAVVITFLNTVDQRNAAGRTPDKRVIFLSHPVIVAIIIMDASRYWCPHPWACQGSLDVGKRPDWFTFRQQKLHVGLDNILQWKFPDHGSAPELQKWFL